MNPEEAYRAQTDWARAVQTPGSPHAEWMQQRIGQLCAPDSIRRLGEPQTFDRILRIGPATDASIVVGYEPTEPTGEEDPTDVFPDPPADGWGPMSVSQSVMVPESVYAPVTVDHLAGAPTYYVTADMCTVMEVAAEAFDEFDLMPRMPNYAGFVVLARPIHLPMPDGKTQPVRAFAWNTWGSINTSMNTPGTAGEVWTFGSRKKDADFSQVEQASELWTSKKAWQTDADLLPCYTDWLITGVPLPPVSETMAEVHARDKAHRWFVEHIGEPQRRADGSMILPSPEAWEASVTAGRAKYDQFLAEATGPQRIDRYGTWQPYLAAFVLLLTQQITVADKTQVAVQDAIRGRKVNRNRPSGVTVVDIRHPKRSGERGGTGKRAPLAERQLVGSHWKWQPYGPKSGLRRRIFLGPYERGPEDAPLVVKPRVTRL